jgi:PAS domain S-box-containing protein
MEDIKNWIHSRLFHQVPISISVIDRDFRIVDANAKFEETYGAWQNRACFEVLKNRTSRCSDCAAAQSFEDGKTRVREEEGTKSNGEPFFYLCHMFPLIRKNHEIPYIIEMATDITENKRLEKEKLEAERLAAVGQTVAGLAHGIKNVLMGLEGGVYVFKSGMEKGDTERLLKGWQMLDENISRISTFVKEFLEFAKGRVPKVKPTSPNLVAKKVLDLFRPKAELAGIHLEGHLSGGIPPALMDEEEIHTCLVNLVSNALDACEISDKQGRTVTVSTFEKDNTLVFEVSDDGTGMDYEVKKKIFTNFFSTKGANKGTGLGLLTTKKIVQEHGGRVSFESSPGEGSVFRLEFPRNRLPKAESSENEEKKI